jgi:hypothetical protein
MKRSWALLLWIFFSAAALAQEQPPKLLLRAIHCLVVRDFVPHEALHDANWGYWVDTQSYPGSRVLYAVAYARADRHSGWVFSIFLSREAGHDVFNIQNNARFVRVRKGGEYPGVSFPDPPLGGVWTQGHIASAIRTIEKLEPFAISMHDARTLQEPASCQSYVDEK